MSVRKRPHVLVTFAADEERREIIAGVLGEVASLAYLADLDGEQRAAVLAAAAVLLSWMPEAELRPEDWPAMSHLRLLQLISAGVEQVPFACLPRELLVAGNVGGYAEPMAEHVLAMVLALAKRLPEQHQQMQRGLFDQKSRNRELRGGSCAILGLGGVGKATLPLVRALGMRVLAINRRGASEAQVDFVGTLDDLETVLRGADVVVVCLPLTRRTRGLIGVRELGWMRPDAILVNVARGQLIDEAALYRHLLNHPAFMAGLEVWWEEPFVDDRFRVAHPFLELPNVLGCPHNSGLVAGSLEVGVRRAAENVRRFLLGEAIVGQAERDDYVT
jgi:phosphoglycerate dehydrogenase-like enzyme